MEACWDNDVGLDIGALAARPDNDAIDGLGLFAPWDWTPQVGEDGCIAENDEIEGDVCRAGSRDGKEPSF